MTDVLVVRYEYRAQTWARSYGIIFVGAYTLALVLTGHQAVN